MSCSIFSMPSALICSQARRPARPSSPPSGRTIRGCHGIQGGPGAAARQQLDQAFGGENLQGLPQGVAEIFSISQSCRLRDAGAVRDIASTM